MEEKKYAKCPECGAPCEVVEKMDVQDCDGDIVEIPYIEHNYHRQPGPAWVKASEQKPDHFNVDFKDKHGNEFKGNYSKETGQYYAYGFTQAINDVVEWKESGTSPAEQPVKPTFFDIAKAFKWAAEYCNEQGEDLVLTEGQWMLFNKEACPTETEDLTPGNVAELYLLQCPDAAAEQPGREVDLKTFLQWLTYDSFLELIGGLWTAKTDVHSERPFCQESIIGLFKEQKKA